ncbi:MAG: hypothetical protein Q8P81_02200 [Nanoarchaeota archaeon]|nr:hypothetical protein [Nanoarchaeota archaeon]
MRFLTIIFVIMFPLIGNAQESKAVYLKSGETAPFNGILLNPNAQAQMIADKEMAKAECELRSSYDLLKMRTECSYEKEKLKIDLDAANKKFEAIMKIKDDELKRANEIAIKESSNRDKWIWWLAGGIAAGMAVTVGITYAVNH